MPLTNHFGDTTLNNLDYLIDVSLKQNHRQHPKRRRPYLGRLTELHGGTRKRPSNYLDSEWNKPTYKPSNIGRQRKRPHSDYLANGYLVHHGPTHTQTLYHGPTHTPTIHHGPTYTQTEYHSPTHTPTVYHGPTHASTIYKEHYKVDEALTVRPTSFQSPTPTLPPPTKKEHHDKPKNLDFINLICKCRDHIPIKTITLHDT